MRRLALLAAYTAIALFRPGPASGAESAAFARPHGGIVAWVGGDFRGADFDGADTTLMRLSFGNFANARFHSTELSGAKTHTCQ
jgi:uncharacterized protein YjbI with pentapeptide repeats